MTPRFPTSRKETRADIETSTYTPSISRTARSIPTNPPRPIPHSAPQTYSTSQAGGNVPIGRVWIIRTSTGGHRKRCTEFPDFSPHIFRFISKKGYHYFLSLSLSLSLSHSLFLSDTTPLTTPFHHRNLFPPPPGHPHARASGAPYPSFAQAQKSQQACGTKKKKLKSHKSDTDAHNKVLGGISNQPIHLPDAILEPLTPAHYHTHSRTSRIVLQAPRIPQITFPIAIPTPTPGTGGAPSALSGIPALGVLSLVP